MNRLSVYKQVASILKPLNILHTPVLHQPTPFIQFARRRIASTEDEDDHFVVDQGAKPDRAEEVQRWDDEGGHPKAPVHGERYSDYQTRRRWDNQERGTQSNRSGGRWDLNPAEQETYRQWGDKGSEKRWNNDDREPAHRGFGNSEEASWQRESGRERDRREFGVQTPNEWRRDNNQGRDWRSPAERNWESERTSRRFDDYDTGNRRSDSGYDRPQRQRDGWAQRDTQDENRWGGYGPRHSGSPYTNEGPRSRDESWDRRTEDHGAWGGRRHVNDTWNNSRDQEYSRSEQSRGYGAWDRNMGHENKSIGRGGSNWNDQRSGNDLWRNKAQDYWGEERFGQNLDSLKKGQQGGNKADFPPERNNNKYDPERKNYNKNWEQTSQTESTSRDGNQPDTDWGHEGNQEGDGHWKITADSPRNRRY